MKKLTNQEYHELSEHVYNYKTKNKHGFNSDEIADISSHYDFNEEKFNSVLTGITCMMDDTGLIIYHCDILQALVCGIENRDMTVEEWD